MLQWLATLFSRVTLDTLPDECLCLILQRLSLTDVTRCKAVSKRWNRLVETSKDMPHFGQCWFADASSPSGHVYVTSGSPLKVSCFQENLVLDRIKIPRVLGGGVMRIIAQSSGLLLGYMVTGDNLHSASYLVGNPLTGRWKILPSAHFTADKKKEGRLIADTDTGHFKAFVLSFAELEYHHYWSFDSMFPDRGWVRDEFCGNDLLSELGRDDTGRMKGCTLFAITNRHSLQSSNGAVTLHRVENFLAVYDQASSRYNKVRISFPGNTHSYCHPAIVDYKDRWILVSSTVSGQGKQFGLGAWELDKNSSTWKALDEVSVYSLPHDSEEFIRFEYHVFGHSVVVQPHSFSGARVFDFETNLWSECDTRFNFKSNIWSSLNFTTDFSFTPGLLNPWDSSKRGFRAQLEEIKAEYMYSLFSNEL